MSMGIFALGVVSGAMAAAWLIHRRQRAAVHNLYVSLVEFEQAVNELGKAYDTRATDRAVEALLHQCVQAPRVVH